MTSHFFVQSQSLSGHLAAEGFFNAFLTAAGFFMVRRPLLPRPLLPPRWSMLPAFPSRPPIGTGATSCAGKKPSATHLPKIKVRNWKPLPKKRNHVANQKICYPLFFLNQENQTPFHQAILLTFRCCQRFVDLVAVFIQGAQAKLEKGSWKFQIAHHSCNLAATKDQLFLARRHIGHLQKRCDHLPREQDYQEMKC